MTDKIKEALENIEFQILKHRELRQEHNYVSTITPAIEAAISAVKTIRNALQAQEWQEIETAPRDGTVILGTWIHKGKRRYAEIIFHTYTNGSHGFIDAIGWDDEKQCFYETPATHWMPLPTAPKVKE